MKFAFVIIAVAFAAALLLAGCATTVPEKPQAMEAGFCSTDSDCHYYWYAGGCYTPENMKKIQEENARMGLHPAEAREIAGATCACQANACKMIVPSNSSTTPPPPPGNNSTGPVACSSEAKLCPDGSAVGRTGPNCEFAPCPVNGTAQMTRELCEGARGYWNECASACRGAPNGTICPAYCVQECECGGEAGWRCPQGYHCTDYLPAGMVTDKIGVCRKNLYI